MSEPPAALAVLHVVPSLDERMGGSITAALGQCQQRRREGLTTVLVSGAAPNDDLDYLATDFPDVDWRTFPRSFPEARFHSRELGAWLGEHVQDFDLVHLHGVFHAPALAVARRASRARVPYVVQPHGSLDPFDLAKHAGAKRLYGPTVVRRLVDRSAGVVCTTSFERSRLVTWGSAAPTFVAPLSVDPVPPADGRALRQQHGIDPEALVVLFLGRFDAKKGLDLLVPAVGEVRRSWPALHLLVVGAGDASATAEVDQLLAGPSAEGWATRLGFLTGEDKARAYAAADAFALISRNENFGITVVEAASAGLPLALSDEVALAPDARDAGAGVVVAPTVEGAVQALRSLLDDDVRRVAGRQAVALARRATPAAAGAALEDVYQAVVDRGARLG